MEALTAQQVGQVVAFVAPGFLARLAYEARFDRKAPEQLPIIVTSVVLSLPLVAVANAFADLVGISTDDVLAIPYLLVLLGISMFSGLLVAAVRSTRRVRNLLGRLGLAYQPESSLYAQTMLALPPSSVVTIELTDGRKLSGTPRMGPGSSDEAVQEFYITHPAWWDASAHDWIEAGAGEGVIVPVSQIRIVTLANDPT